MDVRVRAVPYVLGRRRLGGARADVAVGVATSWIRPGESAARRSRRFASGAGWLVGDAPVVEDPRHLHPASARAGRHRGERVVSDEGTLVGGATDLANGYRYGRHTLSVQDATTRGVACWRPALRVSVPYPTRTQGLKEVAPAATVLLAGGGRPGAVALEVHSLAPSMRRATYPSAYLMKLGSVDQASERYPVTRWGKGGARGNPGRAENAWRPFWPPAAI